MSNYPTHTEQTRRALEVMQTRLSDCADALGAILAGNPEPWHLNAIGENLTSNEYGLSFNGFGKARCPSCGVIDWTLGQGGKAEGLFPKCAQFNAENKYCPSCKRWHQNSEFENPPFYCRQSEGMETPDPNEYCRDCMRDQA